MNYLLSGQESERLLFREVLISDYNQWLPFFTDPLSHRYWIAELESPEIECEKWYKRQLNRYENNLGGMNALISKDSLELVGHGGLLVQTVDGIKELEIGYSILPEFWGKGYATEAAMKCRDYAFENKYAESLISIISLTNIPSENVALKIGMKIEKKSIYKNNHVNIFQITKEVWEHL